MGCCDEIRTTHHSFDSWCGDNDGILLNGEIQSLPVIYTLGSETPVNNNIALVGGPTDGLGNIRVNRRGLYNLRVRVQIEPVAIDTEIAIRVNAGGLGNLQPVAILTVPAGQTEALAAVDLPLARGSVISLFIDSGATIVGTQTTTINGVTITAPATLIQLRYIGPVAQLPAPTPAPQPTPPIFV
mgnify:CR=1 FL=1